MTTPAGPRPKRTKTGIRRIDNLEGGAIAWLYGETDLDDVVLALAHHLGQENPSSWYDLDWHEAYPYPTAPAGPPLGPAWDAWDAEHRAWRAAGTHTLRAEYDTSEVFCGAPAEVEVGWFRRYPWCTCGGEHSWHYEASAPGRGASLAVLVSWYE